MQTQEKNYTDIINFKVRPEMKEFQLQLRADGELLSIYLRNFVQQLMDQKTREKSAQ